MKEGKLVWISFFEIFTLYVEITCGTDYVSVVTYAVSLIVRKKMAMTKINLKLQLIIDI